MESALYVLVRASCHEELEQVLLNLSVKKPALEDEVDPAWLEVFFALEFLPLPENLHTVGGLQLLLGWPIHGDSVLSRYLTALSDAGLQLIGALEAFEDGGFCRVSTSATEAELGSMGKCFEEQVFFSPGRVLTILSS
jgi:hypothetical protein